MFKRTVCAVIFSGLALSAHAQQNRVKLDAPGKVAFGVTYEKAQALLGADAETYDLDPPQRGMKALSCEKCAPLPNVEGLTLYFRDNVGLIRMEAFAIAGVFKSVDACHKADTDMLPKLIELYGKPDSVQNSKKAQMSDRISLFKFADGAIIQHQTLIASADMPCSYTVSYKSKADSR